MLLATLHPSYQVYFGRGARYRRVGLKVKDPLIRNFPGPAKESDDHVLSSWFYSGASLQNACKALKATMKKGHLDTLFRHKLCNNIMSTYKIIANNIDNGFPVMIGWNTVDFGVHCVLVVGYRIADRHWLIVHDPAIGYEEVCWEVLGDIDKERLELVIVESHNGLRPDRLTEHKDGSTQIDRWWPNEGMINYHPITDLYEMAIYEISQE
jgi:hypothetical protein